MMNNLIGITGLKASGKDTVAIILAMIYHNYENYVIKKTIEDRLIVYSSYEIKKFAQPIKEFVANVLGVDAAMMEDREFKETTLGEEWAKHILYRQDDFGDLEVHDSFNTYEELEKRYGNHKDGAGFYIYEKQYHTSRTLIQQIGTEVCRQIHPDFWVNSLFKDYTSESKWIISDCRFDNEAEAIKSRGGIIIKVERDVDSQDSHVSEKGVSDKYVDIVIDNNGSMEDLVEEVKTILYAS